MRKIKNKNKEVDNTKRAKSVDIYGLISHKLKSRRDFHGFLNYYCYNRLAIFKLIDLAHFDCSDKKIIEYFGNERSAYRNEKELVKNIKTLLQNDNNASTVINEDAKAVEVLDDIHSKTAILTFRDNVMKYVKLMSNDMFEKCVIGKDDRYNFIVPSKDYDLFSDLLMQEGRVKSKCFQYDLMGEIAPEYFAAIASMDNMIAKGKIVPLQSQNYFNDMKRANAKTSNDLYNFHMKWRNNKYNDFTEDDRQMLISRIYSQMLLDKGFRDVSREEIEDYKNDLSKESIEFLVNDSLDMMDRFVKDYKIKICTMGKKAGKRKKSLNLSKLYDIYLPDIIKDRQAEKLKKIDLLK